MLTAASACLAVVYGVRNVAADACFLALTGFFIGSVFHFQLWDADFWNSDPILGSSPVTPKVLSTVSARVPPSLKSSVMSLTIGLGYANPHPQKFSKLSCRLPFSLFIAPQADRERRWAARVWSGCREGLSLESSGRPCTLPPSHLTLILLEKNPNLIKSPQIGASAIAALGWTLVPRNVRRED